MKQHAHEQQFSTSLLYFVSFSYERNLKITTTTTAAAAAAAAVTTKLSYCSIDKAVSNSQQLCTWCMPR